MGIYNILREPESIFKKFFIFLKHFEYFYTQQAVGQLNIEDLGNCAIEAFNDEGSHYYLVIKTQLGQSIVMEAGPFAIDISILEKSVSLRLLGSFACDSEKKVR